MWPYGLYCGPIVCPAALWFVLWPYGLSCGPRVCPVANPRVCPATLGFVLWPYGLPCGPIVCLITKFCCTPGGHHLSPGQTDGQEFVISRIDRKTSSWRERRSPGEKDVRLDRHTRSTIPTISHLAVGGCIFPQFCAEK